MTRRVSQRIKIAIMPGGEPGVQSVAGILATDFFGGEKEILPLPK